MQLNFLVSESIVTYMKRPDATKGRLRLNNWHRGRSLHQSQLFNRKLQLVPDDGLAIPLFLGLLTTQDRKVNASRRGSSLASTIKALALLNSSSGVNSPPRTIDNTRASCSGVVMSSIGLLGRHFCGPEHHNLNPMQGGRASWSVATSTALRLG